MNQELELQSNFAEDLEWPVPPPPRESKLQHDPGTPEDGARLRNDTPDDRERTQVAGTPTANLSNGQSTESAPIEGLPGEDAPGEDGCDEVASDNDASVEHMSEVIDPIELAPNKDKPSDSAHNAGSSGFPGPVDGEQIGIASPGDKGESSSKASECETTTLEKSSCSNSEGSAGPAQKHSGTSRGAKTSRKPVMTADSDIEIHRIDNTDSGTFLRLTAIHRTVGQLDLLVDTRRRSGIPERPIELLIISKKRGEMRYRPLLGSAHQVAALLKTLPVGETVAAVVYARTPYKTKSHELLAALLEPMQVIDAGIRATAIWILSESKKLRDVFPAPPKFKDIERIAGVSHVNFRKRRNDHGIQLREILKDFM